MPATTPGGVPYAIPADPLVGWPSTSQQLAEKIDTIIPKSLIAGIASVLATDANGEGDISAVPDGYELVSAQPRSEYPLMLTLRGPRRVKLWMEHEGALTAFTGGTEVNWVARAT
jgi:hypothetical protein